MTARQQPNYPLRMPQELRDFLEREAKKNSRSLNAEIVYRLQATAQASEVLNRLDSEGEEEYVQRVLDALKYQLLSYTDIIEAAKRHLAEKSKTKK